MASNDPKRKALRWTEKSLKDQSATSVADIERAKVFWTTNAEKEAKDLLDAVTE